MSLTVSLIRMTGLPRLLPLKDRQLREFYQPKCAAWSAELPAPQGEDHRTLMQWPCRKTARKLSVRNSATLHGSDDAGYETVIRNLLDFWTFGRSQRKEHLKRRSCAKWSPSYSKRNGFCSLSGKAHERRRRAIFTSDLCSSPSAPFRLLN